MKDNKNNEDKEDKKEKKGIWERMFNKKKIKKNKIAVLYLRNNSRAEPMEVESRRGFFEINDKVYHEQRDCMYIMGKERLPLAIIPEWSLFPIGTKKWDDQSMLEKFAECQDHTIRGIRRAELVRMGEKDGGKLNMKAAVIIGIIVIIAIAFMMGQ